jgi:hypothetical protein
MTGEDAMDMKIILLVVVLVLVVFKDSLFAAPPRRPPARDPYDRPPLQDSLTVPPHTTRPANVWDVAIHAIDAYGNAARNPPPPAVTTKQPAPYGTTRTYGPTEDELFPE